MKKIFVMFSLILMGMTMQSGASYAQRPEGERPVFPVQAALDTNSDGTISQDEIANAPKALRKLDKNGDGKLTEDEVRPNFERRESGGSANSTDNIVSSLLEFDANKDGKLSKGEVPERMQGIFARGDSNKDGLLTKEELQKMAAAQAAASNEGNGERGEREGGRGGSGGMMRFMPLLAALDANSDGVIAADEITNASAALQTLDKNSDGKLTEDELRPRGGRGRGFGGDPQEFIKRIMEFDKNGDGKLSKDELPERMQELMERADTDHDGFLTQDEIKKMAEQGGAGRARREGERPQQRQ